MKDRFQIEIHDTKTGKRLGVVCDDLRDLTKKHPPFQTHLERVREALLSVEGKVSDQYWGPWEPNKAAKPENPTQGGESGKPMAAQGAVTYDYSKITRVTVVPPGLAQAQEWWNVEVDVQLQDGGRTLKVFMRSPETLPNSDGPGVVPSPDVTKSKPE